MTLRRRIFTVILTAWLSCASFASVAQLPEKDYWRWFEVEVLLFRHTLNQSIDEQFPLVVDRITTKAANQLLTPYYTNSHRALRSGLDDCPEDFSINQRIDIACQFAHEDQWIPIAGNPFAPADPLAQIEQTTTVVSGNGGDISTATQPFIVPASSHVLSETRTELQDKGLAEPLLHVAWRQPVFKESQNYAMHLFGGKQYTNEFRYDGFLREPDYPLPPEQAADALSTTEVMAARMDKVKRLLESIEQGAAPFSAVTASPLKQPSYNQPPMSVAAQDTDRVWQLDGLLHIFLIGNYLHIDGDFNLRQPEMLTLPLETLEQQAEQALRATTESRRQPFLRAYRFAQRRRVISHETHYFDHPYLGMIVQIRRTDLSAPRY